MKRLGGDLHRMAQVYLPFILDCSESWIAESRRALELRGTVSIRAGGAVQEQDAKHPDGPRHNDRDRGCHMRGRHRKGGAGTRRAATEQSGRQLCVDFGGSRLTKTNMNTECLSKLTNEGQDRTPHK